MSSATARNLQAASENSLTFDVVQSQQSVVRCAPAVTMDPVLQALPAAVILLNKRGIIYQANPAAEAMLGEPLLDQSWLNVIKRCFRPRSDDGLEVSLKDGRRVKLEISVLPAQTEYTQPGQLIMLTDLTETRKLQSRLSHLQRLSTLGKMMATLAHQIRTPLSAAMLYAENIANPRISWQLHQQFQQKLLSRLQDLELQVNDMLLFARSGSSQQVSQLTMAQLSNHFSASIEALLLQHNAHLDIEMTAPDLTVIGNLNALCGALQNLVQNSIQAVNGQAKMRLVISQSAKNPRMLSLLFSDNGPGVPDSMLTTLFEPFVTCRAQGTGLGLAVVKAVAHSHHGQVQYIAEATGASFEILLPLQQRDL